MTTLTTNATINNKNKETSNDHNNSRIKVNNQLIISKTGTMKTPTMSRRNACSK